MFGNLINIIYLGGGGWPSSEEHNAVIIVSLGKVEDDAQDLYV